MCFLYEKSECIILTLISSPCCCNITLLIRSEKKYSTVIAQDNIASKWVNKDIQVRTTWLQEEEVHA